MNTLFDTLHAMCNLLFLPPDNLRGAAQGDQLANLDRTILDNWIQLRTDYKALKLGNFLWKGHSVVVFASDHVFSYTISSSCLSLHTTLESLMIFEMISTYYIYYLCNQTLGITHPYGIWHIVYPGSRTRCVYHIIISIDDFNFIDLIVGFTIAEF